MWPFKCGSWYRIHTMPCHMYMHWALRLSVSEVLSTSMARSDKRGTLWATIYLETHGLETMGKEYSNSWNINSYICICDCMNILHEYEVFVNKSASKMFERFVAIQWLFGLATMETQFYQRQRGLLLPSSRSQASWYINYAVKLTHCDMNEKWLTYYRRYNQMHIVKWK